MDIIKQISLELSLNLNQVNTTIELINAGNTIPFIARYRKEATNNLDEVQLADIMDRFEYITALTERRTQILTSIAESGKLTPELEAKIILAKNKQTLEDLYLPYKPKRRTRATIAKENGLEDLANIIIDKTKTLADATAWITANIKALEKVETAELAFKGAFDILAEIFADDANNRQIVRDFITKYGSIASSVKDKFKEEKTKFELYYDYSEAVSKIASHRYLAIRRGEREGVLRLSFLFDENKLQDQLADVWLTKFNSSFTQNIKDTLLDATNRLILPSIETDIRLNLKNSADEVSIDLFSKNLRQLLLHPPAGAKITLGLDPAFRTGTKWVVIDKTGKFLINGVIYPVMPQKQTAKSEATLKEVIKKFKVQSIAIGNGTASREVHQFIKDFIKKNNLKLRSVVVNESGASIYSASKIAREEFPDLDLTVKGAISIARRYQDPLAELVKIDPKSIGVGQYQHDVNQTKLKTSLERTVESSVNFVGVDINTASAPLLSFVAGINGSIAKNVIEYRDKNGAFKSRDELKAIKGLGNKCFEQSAGFLKINDGLNPLDNSTVHPESYPIIEKMAKDHNLNLKDLIGNSEVLDKINLSDYITESIGELTLKDIIKELKKPTRDPRTNHTVVQFNEAIENIEDLKTDDKLNGVVTNITQFGVFVDVGVHQDGLVHISQISDNYVKDPLTVLSVGQQVEVKVLDIDLKRKRISLTMKKQGGSRYNNDQSKQNNNKTFSAKNNKSSHKLVKPKPAKSDIDSLFNKFNNAL